MFPRFSILSSFWNNGFSKWLSALCIDAGQNSDFKPAIGEN
jgi:hypothetical protein